MTMKLLIGSLLIFSALTLNCFPDQFLDIKTNTCKSCSLVEYSRPGGQHNLCKCQSGYWFVIKEGKCLSESQIAQIYQKENGDEQQDRYSSRRYQVRNLNQVLTFMNPKVKVENKIIENPALETIKRQAKKEVKQEEKIVQAKPQLKPNHQPKPVGLLKSSIPSINTISEPAPTRKTPSKASTKTQENLRKSK